MSGTNEQNDLGRMAHSAMRTGYQPSPIMKFFDYAHLPLHLQTVSASFYDLAHKMEASLPNGPEKSAGLRKLLEAKDCFVRAALPQ